MEMSKSDSTSASTRVKLGWETAPPIPQTSERHPNPGAGIRPICSPDTLLLSYKSKGYEEKSECLSGELPTVRAFT